MSLTDYKIKQSDIESKGVVAAPDVMSGTAQENKAVFDRLIREAVAVQFNALVDALAAVTGAGEIGAAVDGVEATTALGVMAALKVLHDTTAQTQSATNASVQTALGNRYTKDQTDSLLGQKFDTATANEMVRSISFNAETGVFTVTTQGGAVSTIDTMLERVPASFTLENNQLVLTLEDGTRQTADLSAFIDTYTFTSGSTVSFSQSGKDITAEVRDGSLALSKLTPEAQATLASYANRAEAAQEGAQAAQAAAEAARDAAQSAAATANEKAAASSSSAAAAGASASASAGSASAAKTSEDNAKASETAAAAAQKAAEQARDEAQAIAEGDYLPLAGGTLTGKLTLDGAPTADLHAATKKYVDDAVGDIPTPDVSGQINTHNEDPNAHAAIRESIANHISDTTKHITAAERQKWDAMLPASQKGAAGGVASLGNDGKVPTGQLPATMPPSAHKASHMTGGSDALSPADIGAAALATIVTATLAANGWADGVYILTVSGVTTTSNQEILPAVNITAEQLEALQAANIQDGGQAAGNITLKAYGDVPTIDIPIRVIKRGD